MWPCHLIDLYMSQQDTVLLNDLEKLTVPDLKSKLSALGLPTTGRKSDLIQRLKETEVGNGDNVEKNHLDEEEKNEQLDSIEEKVEIIEQTTVVEESVTVSISEHDDQFLENGMNTIHTIEDDSKDIEAIDNEGDFDSYVNDNTNVEMEDQNPDPEQNNEHNLETSKPSGNKEEDTINKDTRISPEKVTRERMDIHSYRKDVKRRTIHIRNLSDDLNDDIKEYLNKSDQYTLRFSREKSQVDKKIGSAELRFLTVEDAKEAVEKLKGQKIDEQELEIRHSIDELEEKAVREVDPKDLKTLYIGNLPASATKEMLTVIFKESKEIDMPLDNTGKSKGHAYLEFENEEEAKKALETYAGVSIDDGEATRQLKLMSAVESKKEKNRSSRSRSRDKSRSRRQSRHRKDYGHDRSHYGRNYKKPYDHGNRYDSSRPGNRDVNSRGRYNNYRNWNSGGGSGGIVNPSMMQRVNPQAAMNLLMGVSQLLSHQQQQQHSSPIVSSYGAGSGGRNNYNKRRYDDRMSGGSAGHYDRKMPRRGGDGGRHY